MSKSTEQSTKFTSMMQTKDRNDSRKPVSIHAPKAKKPQTQEEFGHFLAGLIDSDGSIAKPGYVQVDFHTNDISVAYYIKKMIGYGKVSQEKKRFSVRYRCTPAPGLVIIADRIRNKLKHRGKIDQFNERLVPKINCDPTTYTDSDILQNHWLAGFIQGDGSLVIFQCKVTGQSLLKTTMGINISQKTVELLNLIEAAFGGHVGYRESQDTYYYLSNSFTNAAKFISYLDKYQVMGNKLTQYWIWRKAFLIFQSKQHLTEKGSAKIAQKKANLSKIRENKLGALSKDELEYRIEAKFKRKANRQT
jgi:hypothetical protein